MYVNEIWCSECHRYMQETCKLCDHFDEQVYLNQEDKVDTSPEHLPDIDKGTGMIVGEDPDDKKRMTNFDKLLEDPENRRLIREMAISHIPMQFCINVNKMKIDTRVNCLECKFCKIGKDCDYLMIDWLCEEYVEGGDE